MPSGGTFASILNMFEMFSAKALLQTLKPYALSPVPNNHPGPKKSLLTSVTGLLKVPGLGLLTTGATGAMNAAIVFRTWGLTKEEPSLQKEFYGPRFTYREFMKTGNAPVGIITHYSLVIGATLMLCSPFRALLRNFLFKPGDGPDTEKSKNDRIELRGVAKPDVEAESSKLAFGKLSYTGSMYYRKYFLSNSDQELSRLKLYCSNSYTARSRGCCHPGRQCAQVSGRYLYFGLFGTRVRRSP
jgi:hypothetical protein